MACWVWRLASGVSDFGVRLFHIFHLMAFCLLHFLQLDIIKLNVNYEIKNLHTGTILTFAASSLFADISNTNSVTWNASLNGINTSYNWTGNPMVALGLQVTVDAGYQFNFNSLGIIPWVYSSVIRRVASATRPILTCKSSIP